MIVLRTKKLGEGGAGEGEAEAQVECQIGLSQDFSKFDSKSLCALRSEKNLSKRQWAGVNLSTN